MAHLIEALPTAGQVTALEPEELGLRMLPHLLTYLKSGIGGLDRRTYITAVLQAYAPTPVTPLRRALLDAWAWLEGQGLVIESDQYNPPTPMRLLSVKAERLAQEPRALKSSRRLPKDELHPAIAEDIWSLFHRGKYDTAVFEAMKGVEVAVRDAAKFPAEEIGVSLLRKAFHVRTGPLTDPDALDAEKEARGALFAGAIGSYKNPQSHRRVDLNDPDEAAEIILLACHLLRIVDGCRAR